MITEQDARELQAALKTTEGREQIAQTMYEPFKKGRDYVAIFRQVFAVDHLPAGAPSWYDLDPQFTAAVVGAKGGVSMTEVEATRVNVDPQILAVMPKVHALDVAVRRFAIREIRADAKVRYMLEHPKAFSTRPNLLDSVSENLHDAPMDNQQERPEVSEQTNRVMTFLESSETTREQSSRELNDIVRLPGNGVGITVNILDREQERAQHGHLVLNKSSHMLEHPKACSTQRNKIDSVSENLHDVPMGNQQERLDVSDAVICQVCKKSMRHVGRHLMQMHGMTADAYRAQFPGSPMCCMGVTEKIRASMLARYGVTNAMLVPEIKQRVKASNLVMAKKMAGERKHVVRIGGHRILTASTTLRSVHPSSAQMRRVWESRRNDPNAFYRRSEFIELKRQQAIALWKNPEYQAKIRKARSQKLNKLEAKFRDMFSETVRFCGYGYPVVFDEKVHYPDFVSVKDGRCVIEVFGNYWHGPSRTGMSNEAHESKVILGYARADYKCLVVWESELSDPIRLTKKVTAFLESSETLRSDPDTSGNDKVRPSAKSEEPVPNPALP